MKNEDNLRNILLLNLFTWGKQDKPFDFIALFVGQFFPFKAVCYVFSGKFILSNQMVSCYLVIKSSRAISSDFHL